MSLTILKIPTAKVFEPLLAPARYKGVYGGRGSGKAVVTMIVAGFVGAVWLGIKATLGK
nr:hypothetical protein [Bradyrhizobium sp. LMTR 3]